MKKQELGLHDDTIKCQNGNVTDNLHPMWDEFELHSPVEELVPNKNAAKGLVSSSMHMLCVETLLHIGSIVTCSQFLLRVT